MGQGNMRGSDYIRDPEDRLNKSAAEVVPDPDEDHFVAKIANVIAPQEGKTSMVKMADQRIAFETPSGVIYLPHPPMISLLHDKCGTCGMSMGDEIHDPPTITIKDRATTAEDKLRIADEPAVWVERIAEDAVTYEIRNLPNQQAINVVMDVLPKALELYLKKSKDYGGNVMSKINLGPKACIPDMQRKFGKLVDAIWWDKPLAFEQPEEILMDLLGHIFIILDEMAESDPNRVRN